MYIVASPAVIFPIFSDMWIKKYPIMTASWTFNHTQRHRVPHRDHSRTPTDSHPAPATHDCGLIIERKSVFNGLSLQRQKPDQDVLSSSSPCSVGHFPCLLECWFDFILPSYQARTVTMGALCPLTDGFPSLQQGVVYSMPTSKSGFRSCVIKALNCSAWVANLLNGLGHYGADKCSNFSHRGEVARQTIHGKAIR